MPASDAEEVYLALLSHATGLGWVTASVFYDRGDSSELPKLPIGSGMKSLVFPPTSYLEGPETQGS